MERFSLPIFIGMLLICGEYTTRASLQLLWSTPFYKSKLSSKLVETNMVESMQESVLHDYAAFIGKEWAKVREEKKRFGD